MDLSGSDWLVVILLAVGVGVLVIGLLGKVRWPLVVVGGLLTAVAVFLIFQIATDEPSTEPSPEPSPAVAASPSPSPAIEVEP